MNIEIYDKDGTFVTIHDKTFKRGACAVYRIIPLNYDGFKAIIQRLVERQQECKEDCVDGHWDRDSLSNMQG